MTRDDRRFMLYAALVGKVDLLWQPGLSTEDHLALRFGDQENHISPGAVYECADALLCEYEQLAPRDVGEVPAAPAPPGSDP